MAKDKDPQKILREGTLPEKGFNRIFFQSELPKVLLVILVVVLLKTFFFTGPEVSNKHVEAWLEEPISAASEEAFGAALEKAIHEAPQGFRQGIEERILFMGYVALRAENEKKGSSAPHLYDLKRLKEAGENAAYKMALDERPFTLMHIVVAEETLRKENPTWSKSFAALLVATP